MPLGDDETRAAAYRAQMTARVRNKRLLENALRGDPGALRALQALYEPVTVGQAVPMIGERR
jgi:hypothetical protein